MDVEVDFDSIHDEMPSDAQEVQARAEEMVAQTRHKLLALLHKTDLDLVDDEEYLADFATANSIEFTEDGAIYR
jgi:BMFP domain-containing protein YqiC